MAFANFQKISVAVLTGAVIFGMSGCSTKDNNTPAPTSSIESSPVQTQSNSHEEDDHNHDEVVFDTPFNYDFSQTVLSETVEEKYGAKVIDMIEEDIFAPMAQVKTNENLYMPGEKFPELFEDLKSHMTDKAWKNSSKKQDEHNVFSAMNFSCDENGKVVAFDSDFTCDATQPEGNTTLSDITVSMDDKNNLLVSGTQNQKVTGVDDNDKEQSQTVSISFTFYMVKDKKNKNHWLIDSSDYSYSFDKK